jgi:hypothetical protein
MYTELLIVGYSIPTRIGCVHLVGISLFVRSGDMSEFNTQFLRTIEDLKGQIISDIETDHKIDADPYSNVARLKVLY